MVNRREAVSSTPPQSDVIKGADGAGAEPTEFVDGANWRDEYAKVFPWIAKRRKSKAIPIILEDGNRSLGGYSNAPTKDPERLKSYSKFLDNWQEAITELDWTPDQTEEVFGEMSDLIVDGFIVGEVRREVDSETRSVAISATDVSVKDFGRKVALPLRLNRFHLLSQQVFAPTYTNTNQVYAHELHTVVNAQFRRELVR